MQVLKDLNISGSLTVAGTLISAAGLALMDDANAAAQIATLGLDADLATFALPASTTISAAGAALIDDATAADQLTTLGALPKAGGTMSGNIVMGDGGTIGQAAGPLITFDDTNNCLEITGLGSGKVTVGTVSAAAAAQAPGGFFVETDGTICIYGENIQGSSASQGSFVALYSNDGVAMASGDRLGGFLFGGSSSATANRNAAMIAALAAENWVDASAYGSYLEFETTLKGGTTRAEKMRLTDAGNLGIGSTAPLSKLCVNGGVHVGGDSDAGDNNLLVDGTATITGALHAAEVDALILGVF
jgi:hypothetical protein